MSSKVITVDLLVVITNYPFSNGGYLVSFSQVEPDGSTKSYDPANSLDFESSKLSIYLDTSSIFLPVGCYYLSENELAGFIKSLSSGASTFEIKLMPGSSQMHALLVVKVDEKSLSKYEQEEEDER